jgi:hypothetical protein
MRENIDRNRARTTAALRVVTWAAGSAVPSAILILLMTGMV